MQKSKVNLPAGRQEYNAKVKNNVTLSKTKNLRVFHTRSALKDLRHDKFTFAFLLVLLPFEF